MLTALHWGRGDVQVAGERLRGADLVAAVNAVAHTVAGHERVAVVAHRQLQTVVAVAGVLAAGGCAVPVNPAAGEAERGHVLADSGASLLLDGSAIDLAARGAGVASGDVDAESPGLLVYTSGTTGPPKGVLLSRRAMAACLDGLSDVWQWSQEDVLAHALPLFHVHGLVLGTLGPLRFGSRLVLTDGFGPVEGATMYFGVPTMWSRTDVESLRAMRGARLLVSGSAALPAPVFERVRELTGQRLVERYGLTESLIVTAASVDSDRGAGSVGRPLPGVGLRIADPDDEGMGEVQLSGPTLFSGYLNRPDATTAALTDDGWLRSGDLGRYDDEHGLRLLGRLATDLVKTGGFKVGAGEVEDALLGHPAVAEAAVTGEPDDDLGERIVAWVVRADAVTAGELIDHVAAQLAPHKRPRDVRFVEALPRNAMGKIQKSLLSATNDV
ncbi:MAG: AMP-binding protein [Frankiales bacterium]|nr:AMP-binding protein [Frankiales bacterium]